MTTVEDAIRDFMLANHADGMKPATIAWYRSRLKGVARHFQGADVAGVSVNAMRQYVVGLRSRTSRYDGAAQRPRLDGGLSKDTIHGHLRALRRFWRWAVLEYGLDAACNPMLRIRLPSISLHAPKAASLEDLQKLLHQCDDSPCGRRDRAMLLFLADTGCRAGGLLSLLRNQLSIRDGQAVVNEKGDRTRIVFFGPDTALALQRWIECRPARGATVFCSLRPGHIGKPLALSGLHRVIRRLKKQAGVTGRVNPHAFRHMFGKLYTDRGGDPASLRRLMGHADMKTTLTYYVFHSDQELAVKHGQFSPLRSLHETDAAR